MYVCMRDSTRVCAFMYVQPCQIILMNIWFDLHLIERVLWQFTSQLITKPETYIYVCTGLYMRIKNTHLTLEQTLYSEVLN